MNLAVLLLSLGVLVGLIVPASSLAQDKGDVPYEDYVQGRSQVTAYFWSLYKELGERLRHAQILQKCGYKKEADELEALVLSVATQRLDALVQDGIQTKKLPSMGALLVARESAYSMWTGYGLGFRESFTTLSDLLPARTYESVCKNSLQKAHDWLEAAK